LLMRYTLRQLEYFITAGETGSITLASERIHISQPSISAAISHLEKELGAQLFIRHHAQGLSLTPAGKRLLREAKSVIQQAESLMAIASEATGQIRGQLSLGCMITLAPMIVPELMHSFTSRFPATQISQTEADHERIMDGLRRSSIDVGITYDLQLEDDIAFTRLVSLPAHVILSEEHPFSDRESIALSEMVSEPMILLDLPTSRDYFHSLFVSSGLPPPLIVARSPHQEVVRTMVANGYGYSMFNVRPRSPYTMDGRKVKRVVLTGDHRPMTMGIATLKELPKSRLVEAFEEHCRSVISDSFIPGMDPPG
jgi:DNA-binding transcriptional LysR family regulator